MTATLHHIPRATPARSAGVKGSPRPCAETPGTMGAEWIDAETQRADAHDAKVEANLAAARAAGETRFGYVLEAMNAPEETAFDRAVIRLAPWFLLIGTGATCWLIWRAIVAVL